MPDAPRQPRANLDAPKGDPSPATLAGGADGRATAACAEQFRQALRGGYAELGSTKWTASRVGFGTYRVGWENPDHAQSLALALASGVNLIDSSANYMDGASEETIGATLGKMAERGSLRRDEVVVVTKAGYMQGQNLERARERAHSGRPLPEVVEYMDGCWHCVHPEFLADQIARSLSRLRLEKIDCLLLHNPEYFLTAAAKRGVDDSVRDVYYGRIERAFAYLETQVAAGTIGCYGVSSNTFVEPRDGAEHMSLSRCWEIACRVGGGGAGSHHFRVAQMPGNLLERGFATEKNQPNGQTPLEFAAEKNLGVLINRPLNAFLGADGLVRLADVPETPETSQADWVAAIDAIAAQEEAAKKLLPGSSAAEVEGRRLLRHGSLLRQHWRSIHDREHWKQVVEQQLVPMAQYGLAAMRIALEERGAGNGGGAAAAASEYLEALDALMRNGFGYYSKGAREAANELRAAMFAAMRPDEAEAFKGATISQIAIRAILAQAGKPCALVGMRQPRYVADVTAGFAGDAATFNFAPDLLERLGRAVAER
jgi:aryl-alcohol dehydrogenase-like predicted oxidoreductase